MKQSLYFQKGYTLIELLLYVSLVGVLLTGASTFFGVMAEARVKNQSVAEVNQQGMLAMERITQVIRGASSITSPAAGSSATSLTLVVPTGSLSPTVIDLASSTTLQIKEGTAAAVPLHNSKVQITSINLRNVTIGGTPGAVQVSFTMARVNATGRNDLSYQKTFTTTAALRWP